MNEVSRISALILTKNEESDLPGCLASIAWCDDIHVFDSFSTDNTVEIARSHGATVSQRRFDGYATHRNAALKKLNFKHAWVLILDADERIPSALAVEMGKAVLSPGDVVAFRLQRRDFLWNTWLKHAQISPFYLRLVRPDRVHYEREINEVLVPEGPVCGLKEPFDHYPFSKGMAHWLDKHNRYSTMEAARWLEERRGDITFSWRIALFSRDFSERRYHQKGLFYQLPGRPVTKFFYMLIVRRAFLDGRAGMTCAVLQSIYEYFIVLKQRELTTTGQAEPVIHRPPAGRWLTLVVVLLLAVVFYLSWVPDPLMAHVGWLPAGLGRWSDQFVVFRTFVPFFLLGLAGGIRLFFTERRLRSWVSLGVALTLAAAVAEFGQIFLPARSCDWRDLLIGAAGAAAGLLPSAVLRARKGRNSSAVCPGSGMSVP